MPEEQPRFGVRRRRSPAVKRSKNAKEKKKKKVSLERNYVKTRAAKAKAKAKAEVVVVVIDNKEEKKTGDARGGLSANNNSKANRPDADNFPDKVQVGGSPVYQVEKKLGKGGFLVELTGQVDLELWK